MCLLPTYYYYPASAKDLKKISTKSRLGQDNNHLRDQQDWHQHKLWFHLQENFDRIYIQLLPSPLICDATMVKEPEKKTPATVSLWPAGTAKKHFLSNLVVWSHRSHHEVFGLAQNVSNLSGQQWTDSERATTQERLQLPWSLWMVGLCFYPVRSRN